MGLPGGDRGYLGMTGVTWGCVGSVPLMAGNPQTATAAASHLQQQPAYLAPACVRACVRGPRVRAPARQRAMCVLRASKRGG